MKINKKILLIFIIYIVSVVCFSGYKIAKGGETYFNYKKVVSKAKAELDDERKVDKNKEEKTAEKLSNEKDKNNASQTTTSNINTQKEEDYSSIKFTRVIKENAKGDDVKKLQYLLKKNKFYSGEITGTFDNATTQALIKFQKDKKLTTDGTLGSGTWTILEKE